MKRSIILGLAVVMLCSCTQSHYAKIPRNGFITHFRKSDHKRAPFDSYWDISDNKDWDERVSSQGNKSQAIYIAPVTLDYFQNMPQDAKHRAQIEALRNYFNSRLTKVMQELDAKDPAFHLLDHPTPDAYRVEIAILSAKPGSALKNFLNDASDLIIPGGSIATKWLADKGYISMGARYYAPNGKLVAEVGDFEYGQTSLIGMALVDLKDFISYAYQRQTIDQWVDEFAQLFTTAHEQKVRKPWFTLLPI